MPNKPTSSTSHVFLEWPHTGLSKIDIQTAFLPINLPVIRMKAKLSNHKPSWDESERPQTKVHVDAADLSHHLHTRETILKC